MRIPSTLTRSDLIARYCERQDAAPSEISDQLSRLDHTYEPTGYMLLECAVLDSSRLGEYVILPYGPRNTYKDLPDRPISPRGLASDMSTVAAVCS